MLPPGLEYSVSVSTSCSHSPARQSQLSTPPFLTQLDPRAKIIKKACDDILEKLGIDDEVLEIAKKLEEHALKDKYFVDRKLYPNVDFYSGIIYRALGFPTDMFTVLFALGRLPGWIAQWKEMKEHKEPIGRPRQIYVGAVNREYGDIKDR